MEGECSVKKVLKLFVFMAVAMIPVGVLAAPAFDLNCTDSVKKGARVDCAVTVSGLAEGETITSALVNIAVDDKFTSGAGAIDENALAITTSGTIDEFSAVVGTTAGSGTITVTLTGAGGTAGDPEEATDFITTDVVLTDTVTILDNDTTITSIKIDDVVSTICRVNENSCTITGLNKNSLKIQVATVAGATVTGNSSVPLKCGNNSHKVTIKAADNTSRDYTFNVNRTCNTDTTLKGITISTGTLNPTFSSTTRNYKVEVSSEIDKITISGTKNNATQTITGEIKDRALQYGDNKFTLTVTSENGEKGTYALTVNRKDDRSTNNLLKEITLSEGKLTPVFDKETVEYKVRVLFEVEKVKVTALAEHDKATIEYVDNDKKLVVGENNILVKVKSENQEEKIYKIVVEKLEEGETLGDNPNLTSISVKGYDLGFSYAKNSYTLKIDKEDTLDITVVPEESTSTYRIRGNEDLKNGSIITITVTSQDGTVKDYTIEIEKSNTLLFIIIAGITLLGAIGLVVYLVIKNKKDKDSLTTTKVKKQLKHDDEVLAKVQNQLNEVEKPMENTIITPTTPVSINPEPVYKAEPIEPVVEPTAFVAPQPAKEVEVVDDDEPKAEVTRVCSICGHRVSTTLKTCPYCKRSF